MDPPKRFGVQLKSTTGTASTGDASRKTTGIRKPYVTQPVDNLKSMFEENAKPSTTTATNVVSNTKTATSKLGNTTTTRHASTEKVIVAKTVSGSGSGLSEDDKAAFSMLSERLKSHGIEDEVGLSGKSGTGSKFGKKKDLGEGGPSEMVAVSKVYDGGKVMKATIETKSTQKAANGGLQMNSGVDKKQHASILSSHLALMRTRPGSGGQKKEETKPGMKDSLEKHDSKPEIFSSRSPSGSVEKKPGFSLDTTAKISGPKGWRPRNDSGSDSGLVSKFANLSSAKDSDNAISSSKLEHSEHSRTDSGDSDKFSASSSARSESPIHRQSSEESSASGGLSPRQLTYTANSVGSSPRSSPLTFQSAKTDVNKNEKSWSSHKDSKETSSVSKISARQFGVELKPSSPKSAFDIVQETKIKSQGKTPDVLDKAKVPSKTTGKAKFQWVEKGRTSLEEFKQQKKEEHQKLTRTRSPETSALLKSRLEKFGSVEQTPKGRTNKVSDSKPDGVKGHASRTPYSRKMSADLFQNIKDNFESIGKDEVGSKSKVVRQSSDSLDRKHKLEFRTSRNILERRQSFENPVNPVLTSNRISEPKDLALATQEKGKVSAAIKTMNQRDEAVKEKPRVRRRSRPSHTSSVEDGYSSAEYADVANDTGPFYDPLLGIGNMDDTFSNEGDISSDAGEQIYECIPDMPKEEKKKDLETAAKSFKRRTALKTRNKLTADDEDSESADNSKCDSLPERSDTEGDIDSDSDNSGIYEPIKHDFEEKAAEETAEKQKGKKKKGKKSKAKSDQGKNGKSTLTAKIKGLYKSKNAPASDKESKDGALASLTGPTITAMAPSGGVLNAIGGKIKNLKKTKSSDATISQNGDDEDLKDKRSYSLDSHVIPTESSDSFSDEFDNTDAMSQRTSSLDKVSDKSSSIEKSSQKSSSLEKTRSEDRPPPPPPPPLPPRSHGAANRASSSASVDGRSSPPLPPRNRTSQNVNLNLVVPVGPGITASTGDLRSSLHPGSYLHGQEMRSASTSDLPSKGADSPPAIPPKSPVVKSDSYVDVDGFSPPSAEDEYSLAEEMDKAWNKRISSAYIKPNDLASNPGGKTTVPPFQDMLRFQGQNEEEILYMDLSDDQVYGCMGQRYQSKLESESLYQFYNKDKISRASKRKTVYISESESEEEGEDPYEALYEDLSELNPDQADVPSEDPKSPKKLSTLEMFGKKGTVLRSLWSEMPEVKSSGVLATITPNEKKMQESMFEIITSEATYLKSLNVLINVFLMAQEFSSDLCDRCVITKDERKVIFSNIGTVRDASERFLADLEARWHESVVLTDVCDIIHSHADKNFDCYIRYCSNQTYQDRAVTELGKKQEFNEALKRLQSHPDCQGLPMISFLLLPMQRITRLPLLVDAICHRLEKNTGRHKSATRAMEALSKVVKKCNEGAKRMQQTEQMCIIANQLEFRVKEIPLISASRYLVKQGEITRILSESTNRLFGKGKPEKKSNYIFLFSDVLLITKKKGLVHLTSILQRLTRLCVQETAEPGVKRARKHEQRLLRNMSAYSAVLELLQIPYDKKEDVRMKEVMKLAHEFLQSFCLANQPNQSLLHQSLELFLSNQSLLEAQTMTAIFQDNISLCNEVSERVIQYFVHRIETHGRHVQYLKFLQTIVKAENQYIRKCQDMVMAELVNVGEEVLLFYNDRTSFKNLISLMQSEKDRNDENSPLMYHINLVQLLALCTEGKNVYTEIKCHSLLPLDDIVRVVTNEDCIPEVKTAYINFLNHCYIDTEVEMKEIYTSSHMWTLFENFLVDMATVSNATYDRKHAEVALENYVTLTVMSVITTFFNSPFSDQSTTIQSRQPMFVKLLQGAFRLSQCGWLNGTQEYHVQECIKTLSSIAKARYIVIPSDLDNQVHTMFEKSQMVKRHIQTWTTVRQQKRESLASVSRDYRSIIEGLQDIVVLLEGQLSPLVQAELSVLVDVLHRPDLLFPAGTEERKKCESGGFISRLIRHTEKLLEEKEEKLCIQVLETLKKMMKLDSDFGDKVDQKTLSKKELDDQRRGEALRQSLLTRYYGKTTRTRTEPSNSLPSSLRPSSDTAGLPSLPCRVNLTEVQCHLNEAGASDLIVDLIIKNTNYRIFKETVDLGIALLEGGNTVIQESLFNRLKVDKESETFFRIFYQYMYEAQQEIKNTITVNTVEVLQSEQKLEDQQQKTLIKHRGEGLGNISAHSTLLMTLGAEHGDSPQHSIDDPEKANKEKEESKKTLSDQIAIMEPILRFLQLMCENHNCNLQNYLRHQPNNKSQYNLVCQTLQFLDCICGSTTGGLGLLGLYINENNVGLINQALTTLTEYCQGPCHDNQNAIAMHESNGIDIIIALILNEINPLGKHRMDLVLELKNNASKLLLAIMESRHDSENAERILYSMSPKMLVLDEMRTVFQQAVDEKDIVLMSQIDVAKRAFQSEDAVEEEEDEREASPKAVGHNIFILAKQLSQHNKELANLLKPSGDLYGDQALEYYAKHTAQIEIVRSDRTMERIVFPIPEICEYLTAETKQRVYTTAERDEQGSKVADFFDRVNDMYNEMKWQKDLRANPYLSWFSSYMMFWGNISFNFAVLINMLVACFYPFGDSKDELDPRLSGLVWTSMLVFLALVLTIATPFSIIMLIASTILRMIYSVGVEPTLWLLGLLNLINKGIFLISLMGNRGTFNKTWRQVLTDFEFMYHVLYLLLCILGLCVHEFFYSLLLLDVVYREETLLNVINSVTRNGRSIILTTLLAVILIYLFSIVGYIFFQQDFLMEVNPITDFHQLTHENGNVTVNGTEQFCAANTTNCTAEPTHSEILKVEVDDDDKKDIQRACDSLIMCIVTTLNEGLRNGGGIGDVLRKPELTEPLFVARVVYDLLFFFLVIIIILNLIFGVIIDTFADLRSEKQQKEEILRNSCFICGLQRCAFDNKSVSFEEHIQFEHNMWYYLNFIVLVKVKKSTEFTGPESYVSLMVKEKDLDWFPRMRAMSLVSDDSDSEQNELRNLQAQLEGTNKLVQLLSQQLNDLKEQMTEQRKQKQRKGFLHSATLPPMLNQNM